MCSVEAQRPIVRHAPRHLLGAVWNLGIQSGHLLLVAAALGGLVLGLLIWALGDLALARWIWGLGTVPVLGALLASIIRDFREGRVGVDAIALVSMTAALLLGEPLAGIVVAIMYAGGNGLEAYAVARAERDLRSLVDRAPRTAHRRTGRTVVDAPVEMVAIGDELLVRGGEVVPVDGVLLDTGALLDEAAVTGEPIPVSHHRCARIRSGSVNAGDAFAMRAAATAGDSTYAGIVKMVTAAQTAKAPFIRLADRFALLLLPLTLLVAGTAWVLSGDPIRGLAVLVAATPCPLILAAPVAFIAGVSQAARLSILVKGGAAIEALAQTRTVLLDKTGTLTVGGARLISVETAPGEDADRILSFAASLEQASHNVVAGAIVKAAADKGLALTAPDAVQETMGSGLQGVVDGREVIVGSYALVCGGHEPEAWVAHVLRRSSWRSALSVFVAIEGRVAGALLLGDEIRREAPRALRSLRRAGVSRIVMITGDRSDAAETIGAALDLDAVLADRVPSDKVDAVVVEARRAPTLMVGDGINDAPALAAADVGVAMGARGASASSEAADVVLLVDRLDGVANAVAIAKRTRAIAVQSIVAGLSLSGVAMAAAALGWLTPVAGALAQEAIDVAVILNALRALAPGAAFRGRPTVSAARAVSLRQEHEALETGLDRLRAIADALDAAEPEAAVALVREASRLVEESIVAHERQDESSVYPSLLPALGDGHGLDAMSRAHREILHLARLLDRLARGLKVEEADRYLIRDAQRIIEGIEALVRLHNAQEEDIYEHAEAAA